MAQINVIKASGEQEPFKEKKLRRTLEAIGVDSEVVEQVIASIRKQLYDGISTQRITEDAFWQLSRKSNYSNLKIPQPEHTGQIKKRGLKTDGYEL